MIRVKDPYGNVVDGVGRVPTSNALVFKQTDQYQHQVVLKKQADRIAELEKQVERLLQLVESGDRVDK